MCTWQRYLSQCSFACCGERARKKMPNRVGKTEKQKKYIVAAMTNIRKRSGSTSGRPDGSKLIAKKRMAFRERKRKAIEKMKIGSGQSKSPKKTGRTVTSVKKMNVRDKQCPAWKRGLLKKKQWKKEETVVVDMISLQNLVKDAAKDTPLKTEVLGTVQTDLDAAGFTQTIPHTITAVPYSDSDTSDPFLQTMQSEDDSVCSCCKCDSTPPELQYLLEYCCPDKTFLDEALVSHDTFLAEVTNSGSMSAEDSFSDIGDDVSVYLDIDQTCSCCQWPFWPGHGITTTAGKTETNVSTCIMSPAQSVAATQRLPGQNSCAYENFELQTMPRTWTPAVVSVVWVLSPHSSGTSASPVSLSSRYDSFRCGVDLEELKIAAKAQAFQCCGPDIGINAAAATMEENEKTNKEAEEEEEMEDSVEPYPGFITPCESEDEEEVRHDQLTDFCSDLFKTFDDSPVKGSAHVVNDSPSKPVWSLDGDLFSDTLSSIGPQACSTPLHTTDSDSDSMEDGDIADYNSDSQLDTLCPSPVTEQHADSTSRKRKRETKCQTASKRLKEEDRNPSSPLSHTDSESLKESDVGSPEYSLQDTPFSPTVPQHMYSPCGKMETKVQAASKDLKEGDTNPSSPFSPADSGRSSEESGVEFSLYSLQDMPFPLAVPPHMYSPCGKIEAKVQAASSHLEVGDTNPSSPLSPTDSGQSSEESGVESPVHSPLDTPFSPTVPLHMYSPCGKREMKVQAASKDLEVGDTNPSSPLSHTDSLDESSVGSSVPYSRLDGSFSLPAPQHMYSPCGNMETKVQAASHCLKAEDTSPSSPLFHTDSLDESSVGSSVPDHHLHRPISSPVPQHMCSPCGKIEMVQAASKGLMEKDVNPFPLFFNSTSSESSKKSSVERANDVHHPGFSICPGDRDSSEKSGVKSSVLDSHLAPSHSSKVPQHRVTRDQVAVLKRVGVAGENPSPYLYWPRRQQ